MSGSYQGLATYWMKSQILYHKFHVQQTCAPLLEVILQSISVCFLSPDELLEKFTNTSPVPVALDLLHELASISCNLSEPILLL